MQTINWPGGGIPFGYTFDKDKKKIAIHKWERNLIITIYQYAIEGHSFREIAAYLNKIGYKSKQNKDWSFKTVSYLFQVERINFYSSNIKTQDEILPPIITKELATKVLHKIKNITTGPKKPHIKKYLLSSLSGLTICGYCGANMKSACTQRPNDDNVDWYICFAKQTHGIARCPDSKVIKQNSANEKVINSLYAQHRNVNNIERWNRTYRKNLSAERQKILNESNAAINQLLDEQASAKGSNHEKQISAEIEKIIVQRQQIILNNQHVFNLDDLKNPQLEKITKLSLDAQRAWIQKLVKKISLFNDKIIIEYPFPIDSKLHNTITLEF